MRFRGAEALQDKDEAELQRSGFLVMESMHRKKEMDPISR